MDDLGPRYCDLCRDPVYGGIDTHPCCAYWAGRGEPRCVACVASRQQQRGRRGRRIVPE